MDTLRSELQPLLNQPQSEKIFLKFGLYLNYKSNQIEGSSLTELEAENVTIHGMGCEKPFQELLDAFNHQNAWYSLPKERRWEPKLITHQFILQLHRKVMEGVDAAKPGQYRTDFVLIKGTKVLLPHPSEVPALMDRLLEWLWTTDLHQIDIIVNFHQRFIRIHPFVDGNGRVCRLLCCFMSIMAGYSPLGFFTITKESYFDAIHKWEHESNTQFFGQLMWNEFEESIKRYRISIDPNPPGFPIYDSQ